MTYSTNGAAAVLALEINRNGEVTKKLNPLDREHELTNTLLEVSTLASLSPRWMSPRKSFRPSNVRRWNNRSPGSIGKDRSSR